MDSSKGRVLVVDDEALIADSVIRKLKAEGYDCEAVYNGKEALKKALAGDFDVVLLDMKMPGTSGTEVLRRVAAARPDTCIVMLSAVSEVPTIVESMQLGAHDYVTKPFDLNQVVFAVERALERRKLVAENREYRRVLEETVEQQVGQIHQYVREAITALAREEMALQNPASTDASEMNGKSCDSDMLIGHMLAHMAEMREPHACGHSDRVSMIAAEIALQLNCSSQFVRLVRLAAIVHDIGKVAVPDGILLKPAHLTPAEYSEVKRHPTAAIEILRCEERFNAVLPLVESHHEWFNGKGYPRGLRGEAIPLGGRIIAVADVYDAMTSARPHRPRLSNEEAIETLQKGSGTQWDPHVVEAFLRILRREKKMLRAAAGVT